MNKYKFRIYDNGKMVYPNNSGYSMETLYFTEHNSNDTGAIASGYNLDNIKVMLFIGMRDKDGQEIYEDDLIQIALPWEYDSEIVIGRVVFSNGTVCLKNSNGEFIEVWDDGSHEWYNLEALYPEDGGKIIGNIHENPELFK